MAKKIKKEDFGNISGGVKMSNKGDYYNVILEDDKEKDLMRDFLTFMKLDEDPPEGKSKEEWIEGLLNESGGVKLTKAEAGTFEKLDGLFNKDR